LLHVSTELQVTPLEKEFILYKINVQFVLIDVFYVFISNCIRKEGEKRVKCKNSMLPVS